MRYKIGSRPGDVNPDSTYGANRWGLGAYLPPGAQATAYGDRPWGMAGLGNPIYDTNGNIIGDDGSSTATSGPSGGGWLQNLVTGFTQYKLTQQQLDAINQVNQINIQRAAAGQPPIPVPNFGQPGVNIGLSSDTQTLLMYGALGIGALFVLNMFMKRRA